MPIDALVSPLPSELTTPPVTKMNLVMALCRIVEPSLCGSSPQGRTGKTSHLTANLAASTLAGRVALFNRSKPKARSRF
jgi:hypothetical protein